eukprot:CCRYP_012125-RA/>CCRYP_012125-RA protein AED:0.29 eAED:0.37 QI:4220/0.5/0.66/1/0/0/3/0/201
MCCFDKRLISDSLFDERWLSSANLICKSSVVTAVALDLPTRSSSESSSEQSTLLQTTPSSSSSIGMDLNTATRFSFSVSPPSRMSFPDRCGKEIDMGMGFRGGVDFFFLRFRMPSNSKAQASPSDASSELCFSEGLFATVGSASTPAPFSLSSKRRSGAAIFFGSLFSSAETTTSWRPPTDFVDSSDSLWRRSSSSSLHSI